MNRRTFVLIISSLIIFMIGIPQMFADIDGNAGEAEAQTSAALNEAVQKANEASYGATAGDPLVTAQESIANNASTTTGPAAEAAKNIGSTDTYVFTTEDVPGAECECYIGGQPADEKACKSAENVAKRQYKCKIGSGLSGFQTVFASIIKYFVYCAVLLGVLALVGFGIGMALLGGDEENTKKLKKYVVNLIIGLTILFLFSYILNFLAPWVFK